MASEKERVRSADDEEKVGEVLELPHTQRKRFHGCESVCVCALTECGHW